MKVLTPKVECVGEVKAVLGESACWSAADDAVLWVDIPRRKVLRTEIGSGRTDIWAFPEQAGFVQPADDGTWLVGQENAILRFDPRTGASEPFLPLEADDPATRTNDAGCDPAGRLFVGTMRLPEIAFEPVGRLYRIAGREPAETLDTGLYVPNGIAFSPDGGTAYWADTYVERQQIWRAPYDAASGAIGRKEPFVQLSKEQGRPDGATVDAEGCYWIAAAWGWQLLRLTPEGEVDMAVRLPVQRPSKPVFGGSDFSTLFVTTISDGLPEDAPRTQPLAGRLLALDVGVKGLPGTAFRMDGRQGA